LRKRKIKIFFICLAICISNIHSEEDKLSIEVLEMIKIADQLRNAKQLEINGYDDLPGTFWIIDDPKTDPWSKTSSYAFVFLDNNRVLVMTINIRDIDETNNKFRYFILGMQSLVEYKIENDKMIIFPKLECYIKNHHIYIGHADYGFVKYNLESTFEFM
jgi:hypothetical protein